MRTLLALVILGVLAVGCNAFTDTNEIPRPKCAAAADCDDGVFCNGAETCAPDDGAADGFGCVAVGAEAFLDDGLDCTTDLCDEETRAQLHDPSGCECEADGTCQAIHAGPCVVGAVCVGGVCSVTIADPGTPCDDNVGCTRDTVCDDAGDCAGTVDDAICDDAVFCNGAERCDPASSTADGVSGCVDGPPPTDGAMVEPECARVACDEQRQEVVAAPTDRCECQSAADCGAPGDCRAWRCDAGTGFACEDDGPVETGTACDDGFDCTVADRCDADGLCTGPPAHRLCDDEDPCNGAETCSATEGCLPGIMPDPLPIECE